MSTILGNRTWNTCVMGLRPFAIQQCRWRFRTCANAFPNEIIVRSYEYCTDQHWNFTGYKKIKQRQRSSFVLGYFRMILWKISTAIGIKHRILATFNNNFFLILTGSFGNTCPVFCILLELLFRLVHLWSRERSLYI